MLLYDTQKFRAVPFLLIRPSHQAMQAASDCNWQYLEYMKTNHFKMLLKVLSTTYEWMNEGMRVYCIIVKYKTSC